MDPFEHRMQEQMRRQMEAIEKQFRAPFLSQDEPLHDWTFVEKAATIDPESPRNIRISSDDMEMSEDEQLATALALSESDDAVPPARGVLPDGDDDDEYNRALEASRREIQQREYQEASNLARAKRESRRRAAETPLSNMSDEEIHMYKAIEESKREAEARERAEREAAEAREREMEEERRMMEEAIQKSVEDAERRAREEERQELEARFQESLRRDQEKERQAREQERLAREQAERLRIEAERQELEAAMRLSEELDAEHRKTQILQRKLDQLPPEPTQSPSNLLTSLQIRLPTGVKIERKFLSDSDTLGRVRDFIDTRVLVDQRFGHIVPTEYKLVADFPRREYDSTHSGTTLRAAGLAGRTVLTVEPL